MSTTGKRTSERTVGSVTASPEECLELSLSEIGLSVRTTNALEERHIFTVNDLLHCTREGLLSIPNVGEKTLEEIFQALGAIGFYRQGKRPAPAAA